MTGPKRSRVKEETARASSQLNLVAAAAGPAKTEKVRLETLLLLLNGCSSDSASSQPRCRAAAAGPTKTKISATRNTNAAVSAVAANLQWLLLPHKPEQKKLVRLETLQLLRDGYCSDSASSQLVVQLPLLDQSATRNTNAAVSAVAASFTVAAAAAQTRTEKLIIEEKSTPINYWAPGEQLTDPCFDSRKRVAVMSASEKCAPKIR